MQVTIFTANCIGQAANCSYPNKVTVVTPEQLREAVKADHVCAEYKGSYRGIGNFIRSDVIVMDIDNDHSEEPAEWITAEKLEGIFPDMEYMLASSRHHLLPKEGKSARPRYHIYFPISEITDAEVYGNLKKALQKEYPLVESSVITEEKARNLYQEKSESIAIRIELTGKAEQWQQNSGSLLRYGSLLDNLAFNSEHELLVDSREESDRAYLEKIGKEFRNRK